MKKFRKWATTLSLALILVLGGIGLAACNDPDKTDNNSTTTQYVYKVGDYTIDFGGNKEGEAYALGGAEWVKAETPTEGFDAEFTLKGEVPYYLEYAQDKGYLDEEGNGRVNFALIRFTSDSIEKVAHNNGADGIVGTEDDTGFYNYITNYYGTDHQAEEALKTQTGGTVGNSETSSITYFLYQGVDNTVRTMAVRLSFDGDPDNEVKILFVIDPANYTLESPTEVAE